MRRTNENLIQGCKSMVIPTAQNFRVAKQIVEYTDERGFPRRDTFRAVEFTVNGEVQFIGEDFVHPVYNK